MIVSFVYSLSVLCGKKILNHNKHKEVYITMVISWPKK
jgi:hypothetical protein